jgi:hypothetical protein
MCGAVLPFRERRVIFRPSFTDECARLWALQDDDRHARRFREFPGIMILLRRAVRRSARLPAV